ncbi:formate--tetrahydrofolate ligase [bacterium]|nr:formate--tetrahydrofolate ligase [bacterium]
MHVPEIKQPVPPNYQIAADALATARPIAEVAQNMELPVDPAEFYSFGNLIAKIDATQAARHLKSRDDGKVILVTAMTPTPKGSGKTLTTVALTDGLNRLLGGEGEPRQRATAVLREPSMGPVFGMKGGAAGGGYSQVIPMEDINLHFTGDIHAITAAHNLLFAMAMAYTYYKDNKHGVDLRRFAWPRAVDMVDRSMRELELSASGKLKDDAMRFNARYVITAASEIMATLGISRDLDDLRLRLNRILVGYYRDGRPLTPRDLDAVNPMLAILLRAINPNLVQTLYGNGLFIHTGPFANIAHGNASVAALRLAVKACDYVLTEGGFGADLGAQKFMDLVCRAAGVTPGCVVIVCSTRDLKHQGGVEPLGKSAAEQRQMRFAPNPQDCLKGMWNLKIHVENMRKYQVPVVVAINRFDHDTDEEIAAIKSYVEDKLGAPCEAHTGYKHGADGAVALAEKIVKAIDADVQSNAPDCAPLYSVGMHATEIIETVAREIYRAGEVRFSRGVLGRIARMEELGGVNLNVCMSKTQFSITDDPKHRADPAGRPLTVTDVRYAGGPGWIVALCGNVFEMPGMSWTTAGARELALARDDDAFGGFVVKNLD